MKRYTITNAGTVEAHDNYALDIKEIHAKGSDHMKVSDGYHTMDDLYEHRYRLFITLCRLLRKDLDHRGVWRSQKHADGTMFDDMFILGISKSKYKDESKQITYHLPIVFWAQCDFAETLDNAPEWDGHTADDVLDRLKQL